MPLVPLVLLLLDLAHADEALIGGHATLSTLVEQWHDAHREEDATEVKRVDDALKPMLQAAAADAPNSLDASIAAELVSIQKRIDDGETRKGDFVRKGDLLDQYVRVTAPR